MARLLIAVLLATAGGAVVVDRIAAVVNNRLIKTSDIEREIRLTDFLNGDPLDMSAAARKRALDRLIDQALIRREVETGGYPEPDAEDVQHFLAGIKKQRFGSEARYRAALNQYGITEEQLVRQLRWQLWVLRFIDQRFRPGILVTDEDVQQYYNQHYTGSAAPPLAKVRHEIEDQLAGERVNQAFYAWLAQTRKQASPDIRQGALE